MAREPVPSAEGLERLSEALRVLPGVGPKSAQRMAYHLLQRDRAGADQLALSLQHALRAVRHCEKCNNFTEDEICTLCASARRDRAVLCVVETPADLAMVEQTSSFSGMYFVLMGRLSPLDGLGPNEIHLDRLIERVEKSKEPVKEVVLATNFTSEGEATAHYIGEIMKARGIKVSRIARGVPVGGELEYVDASTLARAMMDRRSVS